MEKYYTPKIDEVTLGRFEHEIKVNDKWNVSDHIPADTNPAITNAYIETKGLRVKYLDYEDIESLGFKYAHKYNGNAVFYKEFDDPRKIHTEIELIYNEVSKWCIISQGDFEAGFEETTRFTGTIKNINELRALLIQLGVD